jgi:hypothetical protein
MKGAFCSLIASTLLITLVSTHEAWAQKSQRVVVEKFSGPGTVRFRSMVLATLNQRGTEVVPNDKVTSTEADLGLLQVSDNYAAVAKELKVSAFIGGSITPKGKRKFIAKLHGSGPNGKSLGQAAWAAPNLAKLFAAIGANLSKKIAGMLAGGAAKFEEVSEAEEPAGKGGKGDKGDSGGAAAGDDDAPKGKKRLAAADDDEKPSKKKSSDDEEAVSASADESESGGHAAFTKLDLQIGAHIYRRDFTYNDDVVGPHQAYKLPAVPAPSLALDYFFAKNFGITLGGEYSVALISQDTATPPNRYKTSSLGYFFGGKGRLITGGGSEFMLGVAFAGNSFKITPDATDPAPPKVAGVDYKQIRAGLSARIPLSDSFALLGGFDYLHLLSMGELRSTAYFPGATGHGGAGSAGVAFALPWLKGLEGRATLDLRRYVFTMNPLMGEPQIAGGATDQYLGLNIGVGYRN